MAALISMGQIHLTTGDVEDNIHLYWGNALKEPSNRFDSCLSSDQCDAYGNRADTVSGSGRRDHEVLCRTERWQEDLA